MREAASLSAEEALEKGVIEIVASDLDELLRQAHGRSVRVSAGKKVQARYGRARRSCRSSRTGGRGSSPRSPIRTSRFILMMVGDLRADLRVHEPGRAASRA